jgi:hypothetical protein
VLVFVLDQMDLPTAMLEVQENGLSIDLRQVRVDQERLRESVEQSSMPGKSEWLAEWQWLSKST